jgi:hypothetical protein
MEVDSARRADFWGVVRTHHLGALQLTSVASAPHEVRRTPKLIARDDPGLYQLSVVLGGQVVIAQHDRQATLAPSDLVLYDTAQPFRGVCGRPDEAAVKLFTVLFPHALLPFSMDEVKRLTAVRIPGQRGIGWLTSRFLLQLAGQVEQYDVPDAARLSSAAVDVLVALLAHQLDRGSAAPPQTHRRALLLRIHGFIDRQPPTTSRSATCTSCSRSRARPSRPGSAAAASSAAGGTWPTPRWGRGRSGRSPPAGA